MNQVTQTLTAGCLLDGANGYHYNAKRVIDLANQYGANITQTDRESDVMEHEQDAAAYLEDFAPKGFWVGWHDGDFGVWEDED